MWDILGGLLLVGVGLLCVAVGGGTLRNFPKGETQTLSRYKPRTISRSEEPFGFWATMLAGLVWLGLGLFLLIVIASGAMGWT